MHRHPLLVLARAPRVGPALLDDGPPSLRRGGSLELLDAVLGGRVPILDEPLETGVGVFDRGGRGVFDAGGGTDREGGYDQADRLHGSLPFEGAMVDPAAKSLVDRTVSVLV